jgi:hypothetical protein
MSGTHQQTYQRVLQHPVPHDLQWREVWSMLCALGDAQASEDDRGNIKVTRNGQTLALHHARGKDLAGKKEVMHVRHFLERSGVPAP